MAIKGYSTLRNQSFAIRYSFESYPWRKGIGRSYTQSILSLAEKVSKSKDEHSFSVITKDAKISFS